MRQSPCHPIPAWIRWMNCKTESNWSLSHTLHIYMVFPGVGLLPWYLEAWAPIKDLYHTPTLIWFLSSVNLWVGLKVWSLSEALPHTSHLHFCFLCVLHDEPENLRPDRSLSHIPHTGRVSLQYGTSLMGLQLWAHTEAFPTLCTLEGGFSPVCGLSDALEGLRTDWRPSHIFHIYRASLLCGFDSVR